MAACALRKLAAQTLRLNILKNNYRCIQATYNRSIHVSSAIQQKYFTERHEWLDVPDDSNVGTVGITDYAQDQLGNLVYIELPEVGTALEKDGEAGVLESVKAASDIFSPITGEVTEVNVGLPDSPETVNQSPLEEGWLFKMTIGEPSELEDLMNEDSYTDFIKN